MIYHFLESLNQKGIVLASASVRRKEILETLGLIFRVETSNFAEDLKEEDFAHPRDYVIATAAVKAQEVQKRLCSSGATASVPDLIIACDTCVTLDGKIYGKPKDDAHATEMLKLWSGRTHEVITGVSLLHRLTSDEWQALEFSETTKVTFHPISQEAIDAYVRSGEPRGKAGAYGIQGPGGAMVEGIVGDFYNVVGFPLHHFCRQLLPLLQSQN